MGGFTFFACCEFNGMPDWDAFVDQQTSNSSVYEALQLIKATHRRQLQRKKTQDALLLLQSAIKKMCKLSEFSGGADLVNILIEQFKSNPGNTQEQLNIFLDLIALFPTEYDTTDQLKKACIWNTKALDSATADPSLLQVRATRSWIKGDYGDAMTCYLGCNEPEEFADMLSDWASKGYPSELDLFVVRPVLALLSKQQFQQAQKVFSLFVGRYYPDQDSFTPLLNFTKFLLEAIEKKSAEEYKEIIDVYQPSLQRDPLLAKTVSKIGTDIFNIQPSSQNNFLTSMLQMLSNNSGE